MAQTTPPCTLLGAHLLVPFLSTKQSAGKGHRATGSSLVGLYSDGKGQYPGKGGGGFFVLDQDG